MSTPKRLPQWDDWRCYRCREWRRAEDLRAVHLTPSGITLAVCSECVARDEAQGGHHRLLTR